MQPIAKGHIRLTIHSQQILLSTLFNFSLMRVRQTLCEGWKTNCLSVCAEQRLAPFFLPSSFSLACSITISFSLVTIFAYETTCSKHSLNSHSYKLVVMDFTYAMASLDVALNWLFLCFKINKEIKISK